MTASTTELSQQSFAAFNEQATKVWLYDAFCFTPWYSTALTKALQQAGISVRFISASIVREPDYFTLNHVTADPGPLHFDQLADTWPSTIRRILRGIAAAGNSLALGRCLAQRPEERPDLVHLQQLPLLNRGVLLDFKLLTAAQRSGIPVVHTVHNLLPHDSGTCLKSVYQRLYSSVDHLICHSANVAEDLATKFMIPPQRIGVVAHGPLFESPVASRSEQVRARARLNIASHSPVVLWQGVMAPYKGLDVLLQAWTLCMLQWKHQHVRPLLLIAGTGSRGEEEHVRRAQQNTQTIRADIRYIPTAELPFHFQAADILVYPYRAITTSGALLTGLTYKKPIIASDLPPFRQYLDHNVNALLVSPGDVADLANSLFQLMSDIAGSSQAPTHRNGSLYQALLTGAAGNHERYTSWDEIAKQTHAIYRQLILTK